MTKLYKRRDRLILDEAGNFYCQHMQAMTAEQLHSKGDIAAELGYRDMCIQSLNKSLRRYSMCAGTADQFKNEAVAARSALGFGADSEVVSANEISASINELKRNLENAINVMDDIYNSGIDLEEHENSARKVLGMTAI